jgi:ATP-dependent DNA ligase
MKPQLARTIGPKFNTYPCFCQPKLNGVRALYQQGIFQSRDEKVWSPKVLQHLHEELNTLQPTFEKLIIDGELYVHGWRLQDINAAVAVNRKEPTKDTPHVEFHVFDVVDPNRPFSDRWFEIYQTLQQANLPHVHAVPTALCVSKADMENHFYQYTALGYEGIMLRPDGPYEFGEHLASHGQNMTTFRSKFLWKFKRWEDDEFVCVGTTQGEGKADIGVGALVLSKKADDGLALVTLRDTDTSYRYEDVFKVGTGFTDEERIEFMKNPPIGKLIKVRYLCLTEDKIPFNPSFVCVM